MHFRSRPAPLAVVLSAILIAFGLAGCSSSDWSSPHPEPTPVGALGAGFVPQPTPTPEGTMNPQPGSWDAVHPSAGYRVVLLTAGSDRATKTIAASIRRWAGAEHLDLRTVTAGANPVDAIVSAMRQHPDLIITAGNDLIDALATVSASHLDRQFLVIGAEVGEPTGNVTAVDWSGASFRGTGNNAASVYDPATFTRNRVDQAVRAGTAAVLNDLTGIVIWID